MPPGERYYLLLFGSESVPKRAVLTHTWGTVVRVPSPPADGSPPAVEAHTISWMPETFVIRPFRFSVEAGVNLDLPATVRFVSGQGQRVTLFGPHEIRPLGRYQRLSLAKSSGGVKLGESVKCHDRPCHRSATATVGGVPGAGGS